MAGGKHLKKEPEAPSRSRKKGSERPERYEEAERYQRYEEEQERLSPPAPEPETPPDPPVWEEDEAPARPKKKRRKARVSVGRRIFVGVSRLLCTLLVTLLAVAAGLLGAIYLVTRGPSETARDLFVRTVRETSAVGFLADIFLSPEEVAQIAAKQEEAVEYIETDTSLISIESQKPEAEENDGPVADAWGLVDDDGDGIILQEVKGQGFSGFMMVVLDPSRVIVGASPEDMGRRGYTVDQFVEKFDAVAGVNGGGFEDPNGQGNGSTPDSMVVYEGQYYASTKGCRSYGFFGLDGENILHVGINTPKAAKEANIQYGCSYGPILVSNGVGAEDLASGVNPRTAVGQRSDGAILLLVIDGRQVVSLGATYADLVEIMLSYGAVNAINLDGGSSSMMYYNGEYVNNCASVIGLRPIPTSVLVLKEGAKQDAEG